MFLCVNFDYLIMNLFFLIYFSNQRQSQTSSFTTLLPTKSSSVLFINLFLKMTITRLGTLVTTHWLRDQLLALSNGAKVRPMRILDASITHDKQQDPYKEFYLQ